MKHFLANFIIIVAVSLMKFSKQKTPKEFSCSWHLLIRCTKNESLIENKVCA